ncbi:MAG: hypothetical protein ACREUS_15095 [Burkholderiales bacterium]
MKKHRILVVDDDEAVLEYLRAIPVLFLSVLVSAQKEVGGRHAISKGAPIGELIARIESLLK